MRRASGFVVSTVGLFVMSESAPCHGQVQELWSQVPACTESPGRGPASSIITYYQRSVGTGTTDVLMI